MLDIADPIVEWLNANPGFAGFATFVISAAESIAIIGTIVPGSVMMTAIGALVGAGVIPFWPTLIWAIIGAIFGDGISYWLGYYFKDHIYDIWPFRTHPQILQGGEVFFRKHGSMSVFIGRFIGPVRALVPVVAGMFGMRPLIFTIANIASAIGWAPTYMLPGFLLGAASSELPSELAGHLILTLILWILFIFLCLWFLRKSLKMIRRKINQFLNWLWELLEKSRYFHLIVTALKHHDQRRTHGQLKMAFYFVITLVAFFYLALDVIFQGPASIGINKVVFYLSRSLRSPDYDNVFLYITLFSDKEVLLPVILTVFAWFVWIRHWRIAWHTLAFGTLLVGSLAFFKNAVHSVRPWGVLNNGDGYSFPSSNAMLAFAVLLGIVLLLINTLKMKRYRPTVILTFLLITIISLSRLYFGLNWFTDIIGSWLLGSVVLMIVIMSYNRKINKKIPPKGLILTLFLTLLVSYTARIYNAFDTTQYNFTKLEWPVYTIDENAWWTQKGAHLPLYRINRIGLKTKIFNLQWIGDLSQITDVLLNNGWQIPQVSDWVSILYRISSVESTAHLPLVKPLYLDKPPVLVLTKLMNDKQLLILRLWDSNLIIRNSKHSLWVGMVEIAPSTYSWLSMRKRYPEAAFDSSWVFSTLPKQYDLKSNSVRIKTNHHHYKNLPMILIKPKT